MDAVNRMAHRLYDSDRKLDARPTFRAWLKYTAVDLVTMLCLGGVGLGIFKAEPAPKRQFPIEFKDGQIVYPQFAYPRNPTIIPFGASVVLSLVLPIVVFGLCQIRVRSFWDFNNATIGVINSVLGSAIFQVLIKWLIGGLRPHFLAACKPDLERIKSNPDLGMGYQRIMFNKDICTGDKSEFNVALQSFPSGHSTAAFAGLLFLTLYFNGKLKTFSNHHTPLWKLAVTAAPVLGAVLIAGSLTVDENHNWYDCVAGSLLGSGFAVATYRMAYAAVLDFRFNHVPLARDVPFPYRAAHPELDGFRHALLARRAARWDDVHAAGCNWGAPGDACVGEATAVRALVENTAERRNGAGSSERGGENGAVGPEAEV